MRAISERLAIDGGTPVRQKLLPYARHSVDDDDVAAVSAALRSGWLTTGPKVGEFEEAFASFVGARHAVAVANGTAALHCAVAAAGIGPGDEVVVPALTFVATANAARYLGATVRFADVRPDTLTLDVSSAERLITPRTKAIITVDYAGQSSDLEELLAVCQERGLLLIEDAAHALGARYRRRKVGSIAHMTTFSLHPAKVMTTGEGGAVTTEEAAFSARVRTFRNHGIAADHGEREKNVTWRYDMSELGYNYRLSDIQCALGLSQLRKVPAWLAARREIAARYAAAFQELHALRVPSVLDDRESAWHLYVIRLRLEDLRVGREQVFRALRAENIGANVHYIPVPWHEYYRRLGHHRGEWLVAEDAYERMLTLPLFPAMSDEDVRDVIRAVTKVISHYAR